MQVHFEKLFTPFNIGSLTIKNRLTIAPMGDGYLIMCGPRGEYSERGIRHVLERAYGGFGMMVLGCIFLPDNKVDPNDPISSLLDNKDIFIRQGISLSEQASFYDMKIFQQLSLGLGRNFGDYSCSSNPWFDDPKQFTSVLTKSQIKQKIECVVEAAEVMKNAGISGVQVHALHWGYLMDQFAMEITNKRDDEYGGALENRLRVAKEVVQGIKQTCGSDYPVTMMFGLKSYIKGFNKPSLTGEDEAGRSLEESIRIAQMLEEYGYDALHVDTGMYDSYYYACPPSYMPLGHVIPLAEEVKKHVNIPIICGSRMNDPYMCEEAIEKNKFDAVALGRPALADPMLAKKLFMGNPEKVMPCIACNVGCIGKSRIGAPISCVVNPLVHREVDYYLTKPLETKKVMVVGGGITGMAAACLAKHRGHEVELYEGAKKLGGCLGLISKLGFKAEIQKLLTWYEGELKEKGVKVFLDETITAEIVKQKKPDICIIAIGSEPNMLDLIGSEHGIRYQDALEGIADIGKEVVILGGDLLGCELAVFLSKQGRKVTLIEESENVPSNTLLPIMTTQMIKDMIDFQGITVIKKLKVKSIQKDQIIVSTKPQQNKNVHADTIIMSTGKKPRSSFANELLGSNIAVYEAGDVVKVDDSLSQIYNAYEIVRNI
jgi:2-enoate reductase